MSAAPGGSTSMNIFRAKSDPRSNKGILRGAPGRSLMQAVRGGGAAQASSEQPLLPEAPREPPPKPSAGGQSRAGRLLRGLLWPKAAAADSLPQVSAQESQEQRKEPRKEQAEATVVGVHKAGAKPVGEASIADGKISDGKSKRSEGKVSDGKISVDEQELLEYQQWAERYEAELRVRYRAQTAAKLRAINFPCQTEGCLPEAGRRVNFPCQTEGCLPEACHVQRPGCPSQRQSHESAPPHRARHVQRPGCANNKSTGCPSQRQSQSPHRVRIIRSLDGRPQSPSPRQIVMENYSERVHPGFEEWYSSAAPSTCEPASTTCEGRLLAPSVAQIEQKALDSDACSVSIWDSAKESIADEAYDADVSTTWGGAPQRGLR